MFSKIWTRRSTEPYSDQIGRLRLALDQADAVMIGAGSGLSTSAGLTYSGERFERYFSDFIEKYHIPDIYSGGFYPFDTLEEYWAWWSRHIYYNRYIDPPKPVYQDLLGLVKDKDYFVLTTNVDHQFQRADDTFVEDDGWHIAAGRYADFLRRHKGMRVVFLELGVAGTHLSSSSIPSGKWRRKTKSPFTSASIWRKPLHPGS